MNQVLIINERLPGLNDYIKAERTTRYAASTMKHDWQRIIIAYIKEAHLKPVTKPVRLRYEFHEPNKRRDKDNVAAIAHKFIQDALVSAGILQDDGWNEIIGYSDSFYISNPPYITVYIEEEP